MTVSFSVLPLPLSLFLLLAPESQILVPLVCAEGLVWLCSVCGLMEELAIFVLFS